MVGCGRDIGIIQLSGFLYRYYGKKVIILLDEYDTPMQEAYVNGYWEQLVSFTRSLFNSTFKMNPFMERAIMTGITRVSKESVFSDLNNLEVVTTTSDKYADCFGFTEEEVFSALDEFGLTQKRDAVKGWYDGFSFGNRTDIYNLWSIINYLDKKKFGAYWANTSANSLIGKLIRESDKEFKADFENLLKGEMICTDIDEQIIYDQLEEDSRAAWSLFKVQDTIDEENLSDTVEAALRQIEEKNYEASLIEKGIPKEKIRKYGFAFRGKHVLIGTDRKMGENV